jgi:rSAM/selenodomain-associated transferase 2
MISVIIPTLNEAGRLGGLLGGLTAQPGGHQIIVADGGSRDGTPAIAGDFGAELVTAAGGRGAQLLAGARLARGDIVLFLHADTIFPADGLGRIERVLDRSSGIVGGNFRVVFDGTSSFAARLTRFYGWIRRRGLYYGDSAIFARRTVLGEIGGIRPIALMEDYDLARRLEKRGPTICIEEAPVITSSRRFEGRSAPAIVFGWLKIHALYHLGVPPERLARIYKSSEGRGRSLTPDGLES